MNNIFEGRVLGDVLICSNGKRVVFIKKMNTSYVYCVDEDCKAREYRIDGQCVNGKEFDIKKDETEEQDNN